MAHGDEIFEPVHSAHGNHEREHHSESVVDGAGDEVGREDGGVPSGKNGDGEIEADDGVNGKDERGRDAGEQEVRRLIAMPMLGGTAPSESEDAVDDLPDARTGV